MTVVVIFSEQPNMKANSAEPKHPANIQSLSLVAGAHHGSKDSPSFGYGIHARPSFFTGTQKLLSNPHGHQSTKINYNQ